MVVLAFFGGVLTGVICMFLVMSGGDNPTPLPDAYGDSFDPAARRIPPRGGSRTAPPRNTQTMHDD